MKNETALSILFDLLCQKTVSADYLAKKYDVCRRSVYRYIETLEGAGVPLYSTRGREGGFSIIDTYRLPSTFLTVPEYEKAIDALVAITSSMPDKDLESVLGKLKASVKNEYSSFDVKAGNLIIDAGPWGDTSGYRAKTKTVQKSIDESRKLFIRYHDRNGTVTERTIEPHLILFKQGLWYVYAYCELRKTFRFFKTSRIEQATLLKDKFIRQDISKDSIPLDFWDNSADTKYIKMQVDKSVVSDVEEWLGIENVEETDGKFIAHAKLPVDNGLVSKIMSYRGKVIVLSPKEIKDKVMCSATELIKAYKEK